MSRIRANNIVNGAGTGAPTFPNGAIISGIATINADIDSNSNLTVNQITSLQSLGVGTGATVTNPANNELAFNTNGTERVRIDSSGKVGINTDPVKIFHVNAPGANQWAVERLSGRNRGGQLEFATDTTVRAGMYSHASADELIFFTSSSETEAARFNSSGNLKFPSGQGIDFSATADGSGTTTSELFDDYEEGTWTPSTTNFSNTVSANDCYYTKIGRRVTVHGQIARDQVAAPSSGYFEVTGMPFARGTNLRSIEGSFWLDNGGTATDYIGGIAYFYTTTNLIFGIGSNPAQQASTRYIDATHFNNGRGILFYVSYSVD